ncbi:L,D-transpeptidase family protein [Novosphingobium sp. KA1]|uniref:L,D-transpeptidase family protein n=1 Tax=Novosphingobium sp. (strain KA1) TaxID=164608 RepID=UPI001A8FCC6A|nr:L,D-transpeptidase family protein [Novosphingobium sp. KA1]QSR16129.1 L,D-transpeptidase [Novosphingobium sp. KA1]
MTCRPLLLGAGAAALVFAATPLPSVSALASAGAAAPGTPAGKLSGAPPDAASGAPGAAGELALQAAIRAEAGGKLGRFYAARGYRPLWLENGQSGRPAALLLEELGEADLDGLRPGRYDPEALRGALAAAQGGDPRAQARAELALSRVFVRYVHEMRETRDVGMTFVGPGLEPPRLDDEAVLRAATAQDLAAHLQTMAWMSPHYLRLRDLLRTALARGESEEVVAVIRLNIERARVLPPSSVRHIVVDAASARLWYYQDGRLAGSMKVVVGAGRTQTPMLAGYVGWAVFNPYWNVPDYLTRDSIARKVLAGRTLASMRMEALSDWGDNPRRIDPATIDWRAVAAGKRDLRVRELPGPANAMGKVKFVFPNGEGIYLHDTPNRDLLLKENRHFSNGCVRLGNADELGRWLMGAAYRLPAPGSAPEQQVALPVPVPVYLTYLTAGASVEGARKNGASRDGVVLLDDVYGRDARPRQVAAR